jgi:hypothetical protein
VVEYGFVQVEDCSAIRPCDVSDLFAKPVERFGDVTCIAELGIEAQATLGIPNDYANIVSFEHAIE